MNLCSENLKKTNNSPCGVDSLVALYDVSKRHCESPVNHENKWSGNEPPANYGCEHHDKLFNKWKCFPVSLMDKDSNLLARPHIEIIERLEVQRCYKSFAHGTLRDRLTG